MRWIFTAMVAAAVCGITMGAGAGLGQGAATKPAGVRPKTEGELKKETLTELAGEYRDAVANSHKGKDWQICQDWEWAGRAIKEELARRGTAWRATHAEGTYQLGTLPDEEVVSLVSELPRSADEFREWNKDEKELTAATKRRPVVLLEGLKRPGWEEVMVEWEWPPVVGLTDERIRALWDEAPKDWGRYTGVHNRDLLLSAIIRSGGKTWEDFLANELKRCEEEEAKKDSFMRVHDLNVLTALRRIQKKGDPVVVEAAEESLESTFPELPTVQVALVNVDSGKRPVWLQDGGDYRSGRPARWRIEATNEKGNTVSWRDWRDGMGGGISGARKLGPEDREKMTLSVESFVPMLLPGKYTLRVLYHDQITIAQRKEIEDLVVCRSGEIQLTVKPLFVTGGAEAKKKVKEQVRRLEPKSPIKLVAGTYGEWARKQVKPESAQGKILAMGYEALPGLLEELEDAKLDSVRRAEVLGILFSLTGQNDPRGEDGVLPAYDAWIGPWSVMGENGGGFSPGGEERVNFGELDAAKQQKFAARWKVWKNYVKEAM